MRFLFLLLLFALSANAQTNTYTISFDNAVHHEAVIKQSFPDIKTKTITARMSRSSPGRYALHEFAKNVYNVVATDSKGDTLPITRPDPYSWEITNHDDTVNLEYTLFANRGDGTYSQIDLTHAHLNIPATFMYVDALENRPIEVDFQVRTDLNWKVATQLKPLSETTFYAPDLYYFMDSPTEISDYKMKEFDLDGQKIRYALHDPGSQADFDTYFEKVKAIVEQEKAVYGELPAYDYGTYTFLACYVPNASGDGMEHRNSTILTDSEPLADGGMENNIGTVSHEYFHSWNVERIRPAGLEPFDFSKVNMSESLWFAEGFTSYYTNLILARAGIITPEAYIKSLNGTFNYVWNSPAHQFFNPIEMSEQAPFVDAATAVDPVNRENTFISYYSYGSILGLALDLQLRQKDLNLDGFMQKMWQKFGKSEVSYTVEDIENTLSAYAGVPFATAFFDQYIYKSEMPDYKGLLNSVGLTISQDDQKPYLGASFAGSEKGLEITRNVSQNTPVYNANLDTGDILTAIDGATITTTDALDTLLASKNVGDKLQVKYLRFGKEHTAEIILTSNPTYTIAIDNEAAKKVVKNREKWLQHR
ncbi:M61 family metallopeptidase [Flavimarina sp. Hel_I_48]|uniref:M61 family metallopeptidase n=1 Tax=Flavimarina sp. Hel_I_48 TaxID=1392488 RepID=UPI0004DF8676|nr:PDZ domain-containing protein [Flavimarina sp. Hel_I_48]